MLALCARGEIMHLSKFNRGGGVKVRTKEGLFEKASVGTTFLGLSSELELPEAWTN